mmetsp:Transcript_102/g.382  ORF Transcript_102/g.382 Transcript_102/m.382 type:complete len:93 (+) Transcript_102:1567-1845(+)
MRFTVKWLSCLRIPCCEQTKLIKEMIRDACNDTGPHPPPKRCITNPAKTQKKRNRTLILLSQEISREGRQCRHQKLLVVFHRVQLNKLLDLI